LNYGSIDFSVDTLRPLFEKERPGEILRIAKTPYSSLTIISQLQSCFLWVILNVI
jgi:hypothetical protein